MHREKPSFEKTVLASEQDRPDVARKRSRWHGDQGRIAPRRLMFIDETWAKTNIEPLRGLGAKGPAAPSHDPVRALETMTFLAALRRDRIGGRRRAGSRPDPAAGRHRRARQSRQPQKPSRSNACAWPRQNLVLLQPRAPGRESPAKQNTAAASACRDRTQTASSQLLDRPKPADFGAGATAPLRLLHAPAPRDVAVRGLGRRDPAAGSCARPGRRPGRMADRRCWR